MRATSLDALSVLRRQGETHPRQHLGGTAIISPSHVRRPSALRTTAVYIRASNYRGSPKAVVRHAVQVITTRCPAVLATEVVHVFAPAIDILANLLLHTGKFKTRYERAQVLSLLKKAGLNSSSQRTTGRSLTFRPCPMSRRDSCWHACGPTCSALPTSASSSLHTERDTPQRLHY